jgi:hypothetical protein
MGGLPMRGWLEQIYIGRDGVAVDDPLNSFRELLGEQESAYVDQHATLLGMRLVNESDAELELRHRSRSQPLAHLDRSLTRETLLWEQRLQAKETHWRIAAEDACVLEGLNGARGPEELYPTRPVLAAGAVVSRWRAEMAREELNAVLFERAQAPYGGNYLHRWIEDHGDEASESIAVARERAIRQALRQRQRGGPHPVLTDAASSAVKQIGVRDAPAIQATRVDYEPSVGRPWLA